MFDKIIHICNDEKFINSAINQFEQSFPNKNKFFIYSDTNNGLIHIDRSLNTIIVSENKLNDLSKRIKNNDLVVLHSLSPSFYTFILNLDKSIPILWMIFGYEIYNDANFYKKKILFDKITYRNYKKENKESFLIKVKQKIYPYYSKLILKQPLKNNKRVILKKIDYLGAGFIEEYNSIVKLTKIPFSYFNFWYYPLELIVDINSLITTEKTAILIGHSGFQSSNHLDVFYKIKNYIIASNRIIVPLSYGVDGYITDVLKNGEKTFKEKFFPLQNFLELQDYNKILISCKVAILNNRRQQAVGNTIALIWHGVKVFLSNKNPFYHFLKRKSIIVFSYEDDLDNNSINFQLTHEEINYNRKILLDFLKNEKTQASLIKQISTIYRTMN